MKRVLVVLMLAVLLILPCAYAIDTTIHVKTLLNDRVSVLVLDPAQVYYLLNSYHLDSGSSGIVEVVYTGEEEKINVRVQITEDGKQIMLEKFEMLEAGKPVYIQALHGNVSISDKEWGTESATVSTENLSANVSSNETNQTAVQNVSITGKASEDLKEGGFKVPKFVYFIILGVVGGIIIIFLAVRFGLPLINGGDNLPSNHKAEKTETRAIGNAALERELYETKKRLKEAQSEVLRIKNQERIKEIERRINEEKGEIDKIKKGY